MKILFVVQRYGADVPGGAEAHCREFATRLSGRSHEVHAATTTARHYTDWASGYEPGDSDVDGVVVHRFAPAATRDPARFSRFDNRLVSAPFRPRYLQEHWMQMQGPYAPGLPEWLHHHGGGFDVVVFFTYLYWTTWAGLPAAEATGSPTVLHPTAHDEAPLYLTIFDETFRRPSAFAFSTPEEEALVRSRFAVGQPSDVIGVGTDLEPGGDGARFRERFGLGDRPYLAYVGRYDHGKAADELAAYFVAYRDRRPADLALVLVGEPVEEPPSRDDVVVTGFVDDATKHDALAGATALVQPSYYESFSMVLTEAWAHRVPTLVQGRCDVLRGQVTRSGGGLAYEGFAEFEAAVDLLIERADLRTALGAAGRAHTEGEYSWSRVMDRYEAHLEVVAARAT